MESRAEGARTGRPLCVGRAISARVAQMQRGSAASRSICGSVVRRHSHRRASEVKDRHSIIRAESDSTTARLPFLPPGSKAKLMRPHSFVDDASQDSGRGLAGVCLSRRGHQAALRSGLDLSVSASDPQRRSFAGARAPRFQTLDNNSKLATEKFLSMRSTRSRGGPRTSG